MTPFRTIILLLLLPCISWSQGATHLSDDQLEMRLGLSALHDFGYSRPYQWKANEIATRLRRKAAINIYLDRQLHPRLPSWRGISQIGFHRAVAKTTAADLAELRTPVEQGFTADFALDFLQISSGLLLELGHSNKSRPYLSGQLIVTLPTRFRYNYSQPSLSPSGAGPTVNHTANLSPALGWQIEGGMHIDLENGWAMAFGLHFVELDHFHNWIQAGGSFSPTDATVLTINTIGAHVRWMYCW